MLRIRWRHFPRSTQILVPARASFPRSHSRNLLTLAIETSCDDTSVAILETCDANASKFPAAVLHFHEKVTANNLQYRGVHPLVAVESHSKQLAPLVARALDNLPRSITNLAERNYGPQEHRLTEDGPYNKRKVDFISVTRGPGMFACLSTGLNTAKGLAVAWQVPLVAVNHMQAHALTPRLANALESWGDQARDPAFPFLSLLVSGGHTLLVYSKTLTEHQILAETLDIAIGDTFDKMARCILPKEILEASNEIMYGRLLEEFAFPNGSSDHHYAPPRTRGEEISRRESDWGWALTTPLAETRSWPKSKVLGFSFSGLGSSVKRICDERGDGMTTAERMDLAKECMRVAFEHLASRVVLALGSSETIFGTRRARMETLVVSGGVAANRFLRTVMRSFLDKRGLAHIKLSFPPPLLCTDNAAMIAWAGTEMYEAGWASDLDCNAKRKWSVDGDILQVEGWRSSLEKK
ncbi:MAG: hypothetical protein LQ342_007068 [Letrouitia transgressa]|nr:MAG: hypothetical protein LQ342_007068 [Letrouitia transgressa]